jgi:hypothetical protein
MQDPDQHINKKRAHEEREKRENKSFQTGVFIELKKQETSQAQ